MLQRTISGMLSVVILSAFCALSQPMAPPPPPPADSSQAIADQIVNSKIPVLVDFWAAWCGPCRMLTPLIHELEKEYQGRVLFIKVNVDIHKALSSYFGVSSIPAVFIIRDKNVVQAFAGVQPRENYVQALDAVIAEAKKAEKETKQAKTTPPVKDAAIE